MRELSVVHVNTEPSWRGGEAQTLMLARGLSARGHRNLIAARAGSPMETASREARIDVRGLPMRGEFDPASVFGLAGVLREHPVDLLHYHTSHAVTLGLLATLIAGRRPSVLTRRVSFSLRRNPLARIKYSWRVDHLIAVADSVRWVMIAEGLPPDRVSVVHSGIDLERFPFPVDRQLVESELDIPAGSFLVGCVGHLAPHKGQGVLLEAASSILPESPGLRLLLVGEGPERKRLEATARDGLLGNLVRFTGFRDDVPRLMIALDALVLPSLSGEGSPAVVKEAMASGVPVIAADLEGVREIVEEGRDAILVPPGDARRLGEAILHLMKDPALRASLARAGRERVREFSSDRMVDRTLEIYRKVLERRRRPW